jgi:hypothetical protein
MNNLRPEVRVNKLGIPVVKHVRDGSSSAPNGFLARIIPTLNGSLSKQRSEMLHALEDDLKKERAKVIADADAELNRLREEDDGPSTRMRMRTVREQRSKAASQGARDNPLIAQMNRYSASTITAIHDAWHGTGQVADFLQKYKDQDEKVIRVLASFKDCEIGKSTREFNVLRDVASSVGLKDLSRVPAGSDEHYLMSAVIKVAVGASRERRNGHYALRKEMHQNQASSFQHRNEFEKWSNAEDSRVQMTHELALAAMEYPERVPDIIRYLGDNKLNPTGVDAELMRLHLDNPTPALADGIL